MMAKTNRHQLSLSAVLTLTASLAMTACQPTQAESTPPEPAPTATAPTVVTVPAAAPVASRFDQCVRYAVEIWCPLRTQLPDDTKAGQAAIVARRGWRRPGDALPGCEAHGTLAWQQYVDGFERCMFDSLFGVRLPQPIKIEGGLQLLPPKAVEKTAPVPKGKKKGK